MSTNNMYGKLKYKNIFHASVKFYSKSNEISKYSATVLLPKTPFLQKLRGNKFSEQSKHVSEKAEFQNLYSWQQSILSNPEFILHDGPPYANGALHMGHAINKVYESELLLIRMYKILKDIINRYHVLQRKRVNYIPGWDCHGLPIEIKAITKLKSKENNPLFIRKTAKEFTSETITAQSKIFQSWGIMGDWESPYLTYTNSYIQNELKQFYKLYKKKLIYRDFKPVYWSPSSRTALAEAELEYNEKHKSTAVVVRFKLTRIPSNLIKQIESNSDMYALIWTTTPWTLPSNQAICYNPELSYSFIKIENDSNIYIIATELKESLIKLFQRNIDFIASFLGDELEGTKYSFPFEDNEELPLIPGKHASIAKGTGLIHTAPAHGPDDFVLAINHKISVKCIVDELGCYNKDAGSFKGLSVLTDGNTAVLKALNNDILSTEEYIHSYPYDWRTKKPVILRASKQWFIDTDAIKDRAIELLEDVKIFPEKHSGTYKNNLVSQLKKRPFWCISRQRVWGVPIPVFYNIHTKDPIISESLVDHLCELFDKKGVNSWWDLPLTELFPLKLQNEHGVSINDIEKGQDILDIWFDSGLSWSSVLGDDKIADLYLEGIDQFTGWFQSSLLTSVALRDQAPYKCIYVHGFAVDENGHKMSKSLGNVVDPQVIINGGKKQQALGIDTLRWWVACHASQNVTSFVSENILQTSADEVQKIRNTLRFAIGALSDFPNIAINQLPLRNIDKYLLHLLYEYNKQVTDQYENYNFSRTCINIVNFVTNPVSALYYNIIKDRLYCDSMNDPNRRAAQFVLKQILNVLSKSIAPIMPHLIEEVFMHLKENQSFFKTAKNVMEKEYEQPELAQIFEIILDIKKNINKQITNTIEAKVDVTVSSDILKNLQIFKQDNYLELVEICQVAEINIKESFILLPGTFEIELNKSNLELCPRCRRCTSTKNNELCKRCIKVLNVLNKTAVSL